MQSVIWRKDSLTSFNFNLKETIMIESITDHVINDESQAMIRVITTTETELNGLISICENPNSGWIYSCDEDGNCYLFKDQHFKELEQFIVCYNCGYENFISEFLSCILAVVELHAKVQLCVF